MTNALANPSFEVDLSGWSTLNATLARQTVGTAQDGSAYASATFTGSGTDTVFSENVAATPGQAWSAGGYYRRRSGTARNIRTDIQFLASDGTTVLSSVLGTATALTTTAYTRVIIQNAVAPASTAFARIRTVYVSAAATDAYDLDAMQLELGTTLPAYNSGPVTRTGTATLVLDSSATAVQVGIRSGTATLALSAPGTSVQVSTVAGTATLALSSSATTVQVAIRTGTATLALSSAGVARAVEIRTGTATLGLSSSATAAVVIIAEAVVTVTLGDWSQTWALDRDLDPSDLALINAAGCILDGLNATWQAPELLAQPEPVTVTLGVYVPASAAGPEPSEGLPVSVLITPKDYSPADEYDPLLEFYGRVTDGDAVPFRDGLTYSLIAVDHLAELGEAKIGGRKWAQEYFRDRMDRIRSGLAGKGITLEHPWTLDAAPDISTDPAGWAAFYEAHLPISWSMGTYFNPTWPLRKAEGIPVNEMLGMVTLAGAQWANPWPATVDDHRNAGVFDLLEEYTSPRATDWRSIWMQPYVMAGVDGSGNTVYRMAWALPRVENEAGLPMRAQLTGGSFHLVYRGDLGEIPDTSRDGAWIPACAVPKDGISWSVDKTHYPNRVTLSGFWVDLRDPQPGVWYWWEDRTWETPERVRDRGPTEKQLETRYLSQEDMTEDLAATVQPLNQGDAIANTHLGFWSDSLPRYTIESFEILCHQIPDPRAWPRLFPDPHHAAAATYGGHLGRFLFLYGMQAKWNPRAQEHYFGQLIGASLTLEKGRVKMAAAITQRRPGPNGPMGTRTPATDLNSAFAHVSQTLLGPAPTPAIKWTDMASTYPTVTWDMLDPTITALDLWMVRPS